VIGGAFICVKPSRANRDTVSAAYRAVENGDTPNFSHEAKVKNFVFPQTYSIFKNKIWNENHSICSPTDQVIDFVRILVLVEDINKLLVTTTTFANTGF